MDPDPAVSGGDNATLQGVRQRSLSFFGYILWILLIGGGILAANGLLSVFQRLVELLNALRSMFGFRPPLSGPDTVLIGGVLGAVALCLLAAVWVYGRYRAAWTKRLRETWRGVDKTELTRIRPQAAVAGDREVTERSLYLNELSAVHGWPSIEAGQDARSAYRSAAAGILRRVETDIARRAITTGLIVGLNRSRAIDSISILAAALELQLHVLTLLGKRPSLRTWIEMLKRTGASLFLNAYVTREDALYLNLAIRKAALGLQAGAEAVDEASHALADIDLDEILHGASVPGLQELASFASMGLSVGSFGLRQIGMFVEVAANDLLQGVLAGGVLYYHGMSLAAECLALDLEHRRTPEMTRTVGQAMSTVCEPAGRLLRDQVRRMRIFLRERRRMVLTVAKERSKQGLDKLWDTMKGATERATGFSRRSP
jgi:hypothetical protein